MLKQLQYKITSLSHSCYSLLWTWADWWFSSLAISSYLCGLPVNPITFLTLQQFCSATFIAESRFTTFFSRQSIILMFFFHHLLYWEWWRLELMCLNPNFTANCPTLWSLYCGPHSDVITHHAQCVVKDGLDMYDHVLLYLPRRSENSSPGHSPQQFF